MDLGIRVQSSWGDLSLGDLIGRLLLATVLGLLVGIERERLERAAGMRTHAVVSLGAALITIVSIYGFPAPGGDQSISLDPSRVTAQIVSGVGFIGAGVIFMRRNSVRGLTTAASVWTISGIGIACGAGLYLPAALGAAFVLLVQGGLRPLERHLFRHATTQHELEIVATHVPDAAATIQHLLLGTTIQLHALEFDRGRRDAPDTIHLTLRTERPEELVTLVDRLQNDEHVRSVRWHHTTSHIQRTGPGRGSGGGGDTSPDDGSS